MRQSFLSLLSSITLLAPTVLAYGDQCLDFPDYLHTKSDLLEFCSTKYPIPAKTVTVAASPVTRTEVVVSTAGANATTAVFTASPQQVTSTATIFTTETDTIIELSTSTDVQTEIDTVTETLTATSTSVSLGSTVVPVTTVGTTTSFSTVTLTIVTVTTTTTTSTAVLTVTTSTTSTTVTTTTGSTSTTTYTDYRKKRDAPESCVTYEITRTHSMVVTHDAAASTPCSTASKQIGGSYDGSSHAAGPQSSQVEHAYPSGPKSAASSAPAYPPYYPVDNSSDSYPEPSKQAEVSEQGYAYPTASKEVESPSRPYPTPSKHIVSSEEGYAYPTASKEVEHSEQAHPTYPVKTTSKKGGDYPSQTYEPYPETSDEPYPEEPEEEYPEKSTSKKGEGYPRPIGYNTASLSHRPYFPSISTGGSRLPSVSSKPILSQTYEPYPEETEEPYPQEPEDEYPEDEYPEEEPQDEYPEDEYPEEKTTSKKDEGYPRPTNYNTASLSHRPYFPSISTGGSRLPPISSKPSPSQTYQPYPEQSEEPYPEYPSKNITSLCSCLGKTPTSTIFTTPFVNRTLTSVVYSTPVTNRTVTPTQFNTVSNTATIRVFRTGTSVVPRRTTTTISVFTTIQTTSVTVEQSTVTSTSTVSTTTTAVEVVQTPITSTAILTRTVTTTSTSTATATSVATRTTTVVAVETVYPHGFVCNGNFCPQPRGGFCDARASGRGGACTDNSFNCDNPCSSDLQCPFGQACVGGFVGSFCGTTVCAPVTQ